MSTTVPRQRATTEEARPLDQVLLRSCYRNLDDVELLAIGRGDFAAANRVAVASFVASAAPASPTPSPTAPSKSAPRP